jgi:peptidyl-prolyl cis-trans isomerase B (cyclophilin B)
VAARTEITVEGSLLTWLLGDDPVLAAIAAESLTTRPGEHITAKLLESWRDFPGAEQVDRRQAAAKALVTREGMPPEVIAALLEDPEPLVRMEAFMGPSGRGLRAGTAAPPQERDYPLIADKLFGMAGVRSATIETERGAIKVAFLPNIAPAAVANFVHLAERGFYSGLTFHRVVSDFVVQAGDPSGTGWGGPGHTLRDEFSMVPFGRGTMGMARAGKDTAGSQWFITHSPQPHLEGHYTVFAQVLSGLDVVDAIVQGDTIQSVTIEH